MGIGSIRRGVGLAAFVMAPGFVFLVSESPSQNIDSQQEKSAEQVYKNIQVLNGIPASKLEGAMMFMSAALGVGCDYCHTNPWESDLKPAKAAARLMIQMTRNLNNESFSGNPVVNCYTCHRGRTQTVSLLPVEEEPWKASETDTAKPAGSLPATDQIIDKYIRAIGGEGAIAKLKTRVSKGSLTTANRMTPPTSVPLELYQQAPNKLLMIMADSRGMSYEGYSGTIGWASDNRGQRELSGDDLAEIKRAADFYRYMKLRESYPSMRVLGREKVRDREAYLVGATAKDDSREKLYFDAQTGLLVRRYVVFRTVLGSIPEVTDFEDYKEVDGVKLPFTIRRSRPPFTSMQRFAEIKVNVPIDDSKFKKPAAR